MAIHTLTPTGALPAGRWRHHNAGQWIDPLSAVSPSVPWSCSANGCRPCPDDDRRGSLSIKGWMDRL